MGERFQDQLTKLREDTDDAMLTSRESRRVWESMVESQTRRPSVAFGWVVAVGILGLALATLAFVEFTGDASESFQIVSGNACVNEEVGRIHVRPDCTDTVVFQLDEDRVTPRAGTRIESEPLALRAGEAQFSIRPRPNGVEPFRLRVSHGEIVVIGTVFDVEQEPTGGRVVVSRGVIEFHWREDSSIDRIEAGEELRWPRNEVGSIPDRAEDEATYPDEVNIEGATAEELSSDDSAAPHVDRARAPGDAHAVMQRLLQLRSQGRHQAAVALLRRASRREDFTADQRRRLSYQLGQLLDGSGRSREACAHWHRHERRFSDAAHSDEIRARLRRCAE